MINISSSGLILPMATAGEKVDIIAYMKLVDAKVVACLPVTDLERAKDFYQKKLGLKFVKTEIPDSLTFEAGGGCQIFLYKRGATKADHTAISFEVDDVLEAVNDLKSKGVVFETYDMTVEGTGEGIKTDENNIAHFGETQAAWFKDSEGNLLNVGNG